MKKQKVSAVTEPIATSPDQQLYVLVYETPSQTPEWIIQQVLQPAGKNRNQPVVYVVSASPQHYDAYVQQSKCVVITTASKEQLSETGFVFAADANNVHILDAAISFYYANKKSFTQKAIYYGETAKTSGKTGFGMWQKTKHFCYNLMGQLLMPTAQKQFTSPFNYLHASLVRNALADYTTSTALLIAEASYLHAPSAKIDLSNKEAKLVHTKRMHLCGDAFRARINWVFKSNAEGNKPWRMAFFVLTLLSFFILPILSQQFGMTWDERRHNEYSKLSLEYFTTFGDDTTSLQANIPTQEFRYYGEHFNVIAAFLYTYISPFGEYETRHMLNAIYAFFAMLFAALIAKEIGGWRAGAIGWLLILLSPVFLAHGMNNPTDIPFATGFAIAIYYLFKIYKNLPTPKTSHILMAAVGIAIAVGSRVGGILLYAYAAMFMGIHWLQFFKKEGSAAAVTMIVPYTKIFAAILVIGHLLSVSLWPFAQQEILTGWYEAFKKSTEGAYFTYNHELFEGARIYMANVPWYYLPKFIIINSPIAVLVGVALVFLLLPLVSKLRYNVTLYLLLLFTVLFPIVYAEYKSLYYYNGWRHYLFIYPSIAAAAALGWESLSRLTTKYLAALPALLCALPLMWMVNNHPNQAVYFNELAGGTKGAYGKYELDYYSNACREAGEWIAKQHPNDSVLIGINNEPLTASYYAHQINPALRFQWMREYEEQKPRWDYAILSTRTYSANELLNGAFPPKGTVYVVEADGAPLCAVVKRENTYMPDGYDAWMRKDYDSAVWYFTEATKYNPMDEEAWRMLGTSYWNKQSADTAIMMLEKAIEIFPENYTAYNEMGIVFANGKKDLSKALTYFNKAMALKVNYSDPYYYASAILLNQTDYYGAIKYLERGIKNGGNRVPEFYYNLAYAYANTNSLKKAEENLLLCLGINDRYAQAYQLLGNVYQQMGKTNEAQQCMQRYQMLTGQ
jgi:tetratricopeptide (TPR) repeat protein